MTQQEHELIELLAETVAVKVADRIIERHAKNCPWRLEMRIGFLKLLLAMVGSGAVGAGAIKGLAALIGS